MLFKSPLEREKQDKFSEIENSQLDDELKNESKSAWLVSRATSLIENKRYKEAVKDMRESIELNPNHVTSYLILAQADAMLEKYQEALMTLVLCRRVINANQQDPQFEFRILDLLFSYGLINIQKGDTMKAKQALSQFLEEYKIIVTKPEWEGMLKDNEELISSGISLISLRAETDQRVRLAHDYLQK